MEDTCFIWFGNSQSIEVRVEALHKWCPSLVKQLNSSHFINGNSLIHNIEPELSQHTFQGFNQKATRKVIKELFKIWEADPMIPNHFTTRVLLESIMNNQLQTDASIRSPWGLSHSRHRFLVYCLLAKNTWSLKLAELLVSFFRLQASEILENEQQKFLVEWSYGILQLGGLISEQSMKEILHTASEQEGHFGHGRQRLLEWMWQMALNAQQATSSGFPPRPKIHWRDNRGEGGPRASSLPPSISRRNLPRWTEQSQWSQPTAMSNAAWPNFFDKTDEIQWAQEDMNQKLDEIGRKLDRLMEN